MILLEQALQITRSNIPEPGVIELPLEEAVGKHLAENITAPEPSPRYTNSAMDGYAVRWEDVASTSAPSPVQLRVIGESQAGAPYNGSVGKGEAIRISTGAMLALGTDTVIRVEDTEEQGDLVVIQAVGKQGQDVRYQGEEFAAGTIILTRNTRISAPQAALLASVGIETVRIFKPCEVALLITGSELVSSGEAIEDHQIRDSNMIMLKTAVQEAGGSVVFSRRISDDRQETIDIMAGVEADIILCSGGVSVGRHDHVKDAAEANGFRQLFWKIRQKPGKPLYFARKGDTLLFGLPGNPVSAFMCFNHYVRPVISVLNGLTFGWPTVAGEAIDPIENRGKRTNMIRVRIDWRPNGGYGIINAEKQGSHMLTSLSNADGYIILEPGQIVKSGDRIDVYRFNSHREPV